MPKSPLSDVDVPVVSVPRAVLSTLSTFEGKTAIINGITGKEYRYEDVSEIIHKVASGLNKLGVQKGDILAMFSPNTPEYIFMFYSALANGASVTTINPSYTVYEVTHHLQDSGAKWLYSINAISNVSLQAARNSPAIKGVILLGGEADCIPYQRLENDDGQSFPEVEINPEEDIATIPYSSGTTGLPKGVMITHYNILTQLMQFSHPDLIDPTVAASTEQSVLLAFLPFFHAYGMLALMIGALFRGSKLVTIPRFTPETFLGCIQKYKVSDLLLVPPVVVFMAKHPLVDKYDLSSIKRVGVGAAPLSLEVEQLFRKRLNIPSSPQGYGMTETTCAAAMQPRIRPFKVGSCGVPLSNMEIQVVDPDTGKVLGPNQRGELWLRGPNIMKGYLNHPEATHSTKDDQGWLHSGDIGYYDEDCYFYVVDRMKELIKYKAFQVAPAELEALLLTHPLVADAAVIGVEDKEAGEIPRAYVVLKEGASVSEENIKDFVAERTAHFKHLRGGVKFTESIPKSPSGKILRRELRKTLKQSKL